MRSQSCKKVMWGRVIQIIQIQIDLVTWSFKVWGHNMHIMYKQDKEIGIPNFEARFFGYLQKKNSGGISAPPLIGAHANREWAWGDFLEWGCLKNVTFPPWLSVVMFINLNNRYMMKQALAKALFAQFLVYQRGKMKNKTEIFAKNRENYTRIWLLSNASSSLGEASIL